MDTASIGHTRSTWGMGSDPSERIYRFGNSALGQLTMTDPNDMEDHQADAGKLAELATFKEISNYES